MPELSLDFVNNTSSVSALFLSKRIAKQLQQEPEKQERTIKVLQTLNRQMDGLRHNLERSETDKERSRHIKSYLSETKGYIKKPDQAPSPKMFDNIVVKDTYATPIRNGAPRNSTPSLEAVTDHSTDHNTGHNTGHNTADRSDEILELVSQYLESEESLPFELTEEVKERTRALLNRYVPQDEYSLDLSDLTEEELNGIAIGMPLPLIESLEALEEKDDDKSLDDIFKDSLDRFEAEIEKNAQTIQDIFDGKKPSSDDLKSLEKNLHGIGAAGKFLIGKVFKKPELAEKFNTAVVGSAQLLTMAATITTPVGWAMLAMNAVSLVSSLASGGGGGQSEMQMVMQMLKPINAKLDHIIKQLDHVIEHLDVLDQRTYEILKNTQEILKTVKGLETWNKEIFAAIKQYGHADLMTKANAEMQEQEDALEGKLLNFNEDPNSYQEDPKKLETLLDSLRSHSLSVANNYGYSAAIHGDLPKGIENLIPRIESRIGTTSAANIPDTTRSSLLAGVTPTILLEMGFDLPGLQEESFFNPDQVLRGADLYTQVRARTAKADIEEDLDRKMIRTFHNKIRKMIKAEEAAYSVDAIEQVRNRYVQTVQSVAKSIAPDIKANGGKQDYAFADKIAEEILGHVKENNGSLYVNYIGFSKLYKEGLLKVHQDDTTVDGSTGANDVMSIQLELVNPKKGSAVWPKEWEGLKIGKGGEHKSIIWYHHGGKGKLFEEQFSPHMPFQIQLPWVMEDRSNGRLKTNGNGTVTMPVDGGNKQGKRDLAYASIMLVEAFHNISQTAAAEKLKDAVAAKGAKDSLRKLLQDLEKINIMTECMLAGCIDRNPDLPVETWPNMPSAEHIMESVVFGLKAVRTPEKRKVLEEQIWRFNHGDKPYKATGQIKLSDLIEFTAISPLQKFLDHHIRRLEETGDGLGHAHPALHKAQEKLRGLAKLLDLEMQFDEHGFMISNDNDESSTTTGTGGGSALPGTLRRYHDARLVHCR